MEKESLSLKPKIKMLTFHQFCLINISQFSATESREVYGNM